MRNALTPAVKNLLIINVLVFAASFVLGQRGFDLEQNFGLHFILSDQFRPWQFVTYMFLHGCLEHIFFNMFALWMFGCLIERTQGTKRFLIYYFVCGIGAGICQEIAQTIHYSMLNTMMVPDGLGGMVDCVLLDGYPQPVMLSSYLATWNCVGASGAIYGILLAFAMYYPNERMFIIPIPFPIKAKYMVLGYTVIELMSVVTRANDGVAHMAHLGGMIFGALLIIYWRRRDNRRQGEAVYVTFTR